MPFSILLGDVTRIGARLIVNPTDPDYSGSGGLDQQIHRLAGPELARHCAALPRLDYGRAVLTPAFELGALAVIHTAAPVWTPGGESEALLRSCYRESLALVRDLDAPTVALPLIGTGTQAYPRALALRIAQHVHHGAAVTHIRLIHARSVLTGSGQHNAVAVQDIPRHHILLLGPHPGIP